MVLKSWFLIDLWKSIKSFIPVKLRVIVPCRISKALAGTSVRAKREIILSMLVT